MTATLCGMVQLKPFQFMARSSANGVAKLVGTNLDSEVSPVQPHLAECGLHHRLGGVLGDGVAEDADKLLFEVRTGHGGVPSRSG